MPGFDMRDVPMDGRQVLLHSRIHGWIEGYFSKGEWSDDTPICPSEYSGDAWVLGDDLEQVEVEFYGDPDNTIHHGQLDGWYPVDYIGVDKDRVRQKQEEAAALKVLELKGMKLSTVQLSKACMALPSVIERLFGQGTRYHVKV